MKFNYRLAFWLAQGQSRKIALLILCIALGVSARVSIGSFMGQLNQTLYREARNLLSADIEVYSSTPLRPKLLTELNQVLPPGARTQKLISFVSMTSTSKNNRTRLVELKAVEENYPFYGDLVLSDSNQNPSSQLFGEEPSVYVEKELLRILDVDIGDTIRLGSLDFVIAGTIIKEPGLGSSVFSLGPRVLVGMKHIQKTGLVGMKSNIYYSLLVALPEPSMAVPLTKEIRKMWNLGDPRRWFTRDMRSVKEVRVRNFIDRQYQVRRFFDRLADYLNLVALIALLLGGIGVGSVVRGYIAEQYKSVAILLVQGASLWRIYKVYLLQLLILGLVGGAVGALLGTLIQFSLPILLAETLSVSVELGIDISSILWGLFLGVSVTLLFGALPLLRLEKLKPLNIFRGDDSVEFNSKWFWVVTIIGVALLSALSIYESRSMTKGLLFTGSVLGGGIVIYLFSLVLLPFLSKIRFLFTNFSIKHGLANLNRPGLNPHSAMIAIGLSAFLLGVLTIYQFSLLNELNPEKEDGKIPNFFLIDIQDDQVEELDRYFKGQGVTEVMLSPMIKARFRKLSDTQGKSSNLEDNERMRNRESNLSYRNEIGRNEQIVEGKWMSGSQDTIEASIEEGYAERIGAKLQDQLTFDIQGVKIEATVTSIRKVRWSSFLPTFFVLLSPWALQDAPKIWVGSVLGFGDKTKSEFENSLFNQFPNVTLLDVGEASKKIRILVDKISWSVRFIALFSLFAGLVVLIGIALSTGRQRQKDSVVLKVVGSQRKVILSSIAIEFGVLGGLAGTLGFALSLGFGWVLLVRFLDLQFVIPWKELTGLLFVLTTLSSITGVLSCRRSLSVKPLEIFRENV